jgi:hypothetical protein
MNKLNLSVALVLGSVMTSALAHGAGDDKKPPAAPAKVAPGPELAAYKAWAGNWKCEGKFTEAGVDHPIKGTSRMAWDLDGFWLVEQAQGLTHKGVNTWGYSTAKKAYVMFSVDNFGDWAHETSTGPDASGKWEWTGKGSDNGKDVEVKDTITLSADGKTFTATGTDTAGSSYTAICKK